MKRSNKKGFTIVELVIVIAVIAILAAVLIPTFSGLIKKANIASDTALARNLNETIAMSETEVKTFEDALAAMKEGGYLIANLNAKTDGCYFVWEADSKQILLVDSKEDFKVLYANSETYTAIGATWNIAISDVAKAAEIEAAGKNLSVKRAIANVADFNSALAAGGEQTLYIDESIVMEGANAFVFDKEDGVTTIQLGNSAVSNTDPAKSEIPFVLKKGELTLNSGVISATGKIVDADGKDLYIPLDTAYGTTATINDTTFNMTGDGIISFCGDATANNITVSSDSNGIGVYHGANVVLNNATVTAGMKCVFVSNHSGDGDHTTYTSKMTINGGTYTSDAAVLEVYSGELEINGGTFKRTSQGPVLFLYNNAFATKATVKGGTFIMGDGTTYEYEDLTIDILKEICKTKQGEYTVDITGSVAEGFVIVDKK